MAIESGFLRTQDVKVYVKNEATLGVSESVATGFLQLPIISISQPENNVAVEQSASAVGRYAKE